MMVTVDEQSQQPALPPPHHGDAPVGAPARFGGWAPPPPPPGGWDTGGWQPSPWGAPPPPPHRRRAGAALIAIALVVFSAVAIAIAVPGLFHRNGQQGGGLGGIFNSSNGQVDVSGVTSRVAPAVVDITASFPDGLVAGTGMVITSSGEVLTNNHVVESAGAIDVQVGGTGRVYRARVVGTDPNADVALLQMQGASGLQTINVGGTVAVGDPVVAIGNALGREGPPSASAGQVTALDRTITATDESGMSSETLTGLIQVDANVVPGDSGGPLVDRSGRVVGMDTAASARRFRFRSGSSQGFAIPIATAMSVAGRLRSGGGVQPSAQPAATARLGVELSDTADVAGGGAAVAGVQAGSPADRAGIAAGDVIVSLDGNAVQSATDLRAAIRAHHPGDRVQVAWLDENGQQHTAEVVLASAGG